MDYELVKKLSRKRVRSLAELAALDPVSRLDALTSAGALAQRVRPLRLRLWCLAAAHAPAELAGTKSCRDLTRASLVACAYPLPGSLNVDVTACFGHDEATASLQATQACARLRQWVCERQA